MRICEVNGCGKIVNARGLCGMHYWRLRNFGDVEYERVVEKKICIIDACNKDGIKRGMCAMHYRRWRIHGSTFLPKEKERAPKGMAAEWVLDNLYHDGEECLIFPFGKGGNKTPYKYGRISIDGKLESVHVVMATILYGERPTQSHQVRHICGNGHLGCANPKHLAWGTVKENCLDKVEHGTDIRCEKHPMTGFTNSDVLEILALLSDGWTQWDIARKYGVTQSAISGIKLGKTWGFVTGIQRANRKN